MESQIVFLHNQKTNIRINQTEKDGDCYIVLEQCIPLKSC